MTSLRQIVAQADDAVAGTQPRDTSASPRLAICIAEDRQSCEPAIMLLVASISKHCPSVSVELFAPNATDTLVTWLVDYPLVHLSREHAGNGSSKYDVKPRALLKILDRGYSEVIWLDSDILVCRNFLPFFARLGPQVIAVAEEALCSGHGDP